MQAEVDAWQELLESFPESSGSPTTWEIPVRVTACYKDNGNSWTWPVNEDYVDNWMLGKMNTKMTIGPNTYHFFRCGPINYVDITQFHSGTEDILQFSWVPGVLNFFFTGVKTPAGKDVRSHSSFPWDSDHYVVLNGGPNGTALHELGHTVGMLHTFLPAIEYVVPVKMNQSDHPTKPEGEGRELNIKQELDGNDPREFHLPNNTFAGDGVSGTPPGCLHNTPDSDVSGFFPSSASIAGCLDNNPNTLCKNGCLDADPATPCVNGCVFDEINCTLTGDYRDYNFDLIDDPNNIRLKNFMSYTGYCASEFTLGQVVERADKSMAAGLQAYYKPNHCGTLSDRIELTSSSTGLKRVRMTVTPTASPDYYFKTIDSKEGDFNGRLVNAVDEHEVKANVRLLGSNPDFTFTNADWLNGISVADLKTISAHILGISKMNGYHQLASDVNHDGLVSTSDIIELKKLLLGIYTKLPAYDQPWRFIPERVTLLPNGAVQNDFNGSPPNALAFDNPFYTLVDGQLVVGAPYTEPGWAFKMKTANGRNGFDAVKLGNADNSVTGFQNDCPDEIIAVIPSVSLDENQQFELLVKGYNFSEIVAFQLGMATSALDFEFLDFQSETLPELMEEQSLGGLNLGQNNLKILWMADSLNANSTANGTTLFKLKLKALQPIENLSEALHLDDEVLENLFVGSVNPCESDVSLEFELNLLSQSGGEGEDRSSQSNRPRQSSNGAFICLPNPVQNDATLLFDATDETEGLLLAHDTNGRLLFENKVRLDSGRNAIHLPEMADFPSGLLNLTIRTAEENRTLRIVKY